MPTLEATYQPELPFPDSEALHSVLRLDDAAILEGSLAVRGFYWEDLPGEVFDDGDVCFHDGTEVDVSDVFGGILAQFAGPEDKDVIEVIKYAYKIKKGRILEEI